MSLEHIAGTRNIPAALMTLFLGLWNSTGIALCGWQEAPKLLKGSLGSKRPRVSLLEREETYSMTSGASWQTASQTQLQLSIT
jgi:hypothetical protein